MQAATVGGAPVCEAAFAPPARRKAWVAPGCLRAARQMIAGAEQIAWARARSFAIAHGLKPRRRRRIGWA